MCSALLADYPFAGLESIQSVASTTSTSAPTISRLVTKLGFSGYQDFQRYLISELKSEQRSPVDLQLISEPIEGAYLKNFLGRSAGLIAESQHTVTEEQFERVCALLSDRKRHIYLIGGRMSDGLVQYLARHLNQIREHVTHLPSDSEQLPNYLLSMRPKDVLVIADFRRYQSGLTKLAERASRDRKTQIIAITDKWMSPVSRHATEVLAIPIDSGTLWDSYSATLAVLEAVVTRIAEQNWDSTKERIESWDDYRSNFSERSQ